MSISSPEQIQAPCSVACLHSRHAYMHSRHTCLTDRHSCDAQAKRLQQYQERIAQESEAVLLRAETQRAQSNLELLVKSLGEEQAEQSMEARYAAVSAFVKLDRRHIMPAAYRLFLGTSMPGMNAQG